MSQQDLAFENVTEANDVISVLNEASIRGVPVFGSIVTSGGTTREFEFKIKAAKGTRIVLVPAAASLAASAPQLLPKEIQPGLELELIFSTSSGQYAVRDVIADASLTTLTVNAAQSLLRQQRRRDFRVPIRPGHIQCWVQRADALRIHPEIPVTLVDLSAGGMKLRWLAHHLPSMQEGAEIAGRIQLAADREVEFEAKLVTSFGPVPGSQNEAAAGFEFMGLKQPDSRAILFTCLQLHREVFGR